MQSQVNSPRHNVKTHGHEAPQESFISLNALFKEHPSLCTSHQEVLLDRRQRLLYQSRDTDDEKDHLGDQ